MAKLTLKQENFCQAYIKTGNASEAYRQSYNAEKMSAKTVNVKTSELLSNGNITVRIAELQAEIKTDFLVSINEKRRWLWEKIQDDEQPLSPRVACMREMNLLDGDYANQRVEVDYGGDEYWIKKISAELTSWNARDALDYYLDDPFNRPLEDVFKKFKAEQGY